MPVDLPQLLAPDGPIARRLKGDFEVRPEQARMMDAVRDALTRRRVLLVEAGTGVGKSFAYLLPAIAHVIEAREDDTRGERCRVVVSTHTIALQEQLIDRDLPLLRAVIPDEFTAVLVKGRSNYVSLRRMERAFERRASLFPDDPMAEESLRVIQAWAAATTDGTLASLPQLSSRTVWDDVRSDADDCQGRKCPKFERCFYQADRRRMQNADLLVVNHSLFFADLALRKEGFGLLPSYEYVILDEAHTIEDVAAEHFGCRLARYGVERTLNRLAHPRRQTGVLAGLSHLAEEGPLRHAMALIDDARSACESLFEELAESVPRRRGDRDPDDTRADDPGDRESGEVRVRSPLGVADDLTPRLKDLSTLLRSLRGGLKDEDARSELEMYANRLEGYAATVSGWLQQKLGDSVYWLEVSRSRRWGPRVSLCAAPVSVREVLADRLFSAMGPDRKPIGVVLTSATLATAGPTDAASDHRDAAGASPGPRQSPTPESSPRRAARVPESPFAYLIGRLGCDGSDTLLLGSPFDYRRQARLIAAADLPAPNEAGYFDRLCPRLLDHLDRSDGGAFVLFTSYDLLRRVASWLRPRLSERSMPMLVQGEGLQRSVMLEMFRRNRRAVLLGVHSFWQGVDVRGEALRNVIVPRLPFEAPDRPVVEARSERVTAEGGNAFRDFSLPGAVLLFKQGFGRLIRSRSDTGTVVVLDSRLVNKPYGRKFLEALPPLPLVVEGERDRRRGTSRA